jgi:hypothetical protein
MVAENNVLVMFCNQPPFFEARFVDFSCFSFSSFSFSSFSLSSLSFSADAAAALMSDIDLARGFSSGLVSNSFGGPRRLPFLSRGFGVLGALGLCFGDTGGASCGASGGGGVSSCTLGRSLAVRPRAAPD